MLDNEIRATEVAPKQTSNDQTKGQDNTGLDNYLTIFESVEPINKLYERNAVGEVVRIAKTGGKFFGGVATKVKVDGMVELGKVLKEVGNNPNMCIGLGYHVGVEVDVKYEVLSQLEWERCVAEGTIEKTGELMAVRKDGIVSTVRKQEVMRHSCYAVFDKDIAGGWDGWSAKVGQLGWRDAWAKCEKLIVPSNSARVGALGGEDKWHVYVRVEDSADLNGSDFGGRLRSTAESLGTPRVIDHVVFTSERVLFEGSPLIDGTRGEVKDSVVRIEGIVGHTLDTSIIKHVNCPKVGRKVKTLDVEGNVVEKHVFTRSAVVDYDTLMLETVIETSKLGGGVEYLTVRELQADDRWDGSKLRCQVPKELNDRGSVSENGVLREVNGCVQLYDNGDDITYRVADMSVGVGKRLIHTASLGSDLDLADEIIELPHVNDIKVMFTTVSPSNAHVADAIGKAYFYENFRWVDDSYWISWNGIEWKKGGAKGQLGDIMMMLGESMNESEEITDAGLVAFCKDSNVNGVLNVMREACRMSSDEFDNDDNLLGLVDGSVVDLQTGKNVMPKREQYIMLRTGVNVEQGEAVELMRFLRSTFDEEMIEYIQYLCGYALTGNVDQQRLYMHFGRGQNGKSVMAGVMEGIMGSYHAIANPSLIEEQKMEQHSQSLEVLKRKRLVVVNEVSKNMVMNERKAKSLSGGDSITSRAMFGTDGSWTPNFKLWMIGNTPPTVKEGGVAMRRRTQMIEYKRVVADGDVDRGLKDKLVNGRTLAWMIEGAIKYSMLFGGDIPVPSIVVKDSKDYLDGEDMLTQFIEEVFDKNKVRGGNVSLKHAHEVYCDWVIEQGFKGGGVLPRFKKELKQHGLRVYRSKNVDKIDGYALKSVWAQPVGARLINLAK